jgi:hypothetical protein
MKLHRNDPWDMFKFTLPIIAMNVQKIFDLWISKHWISGRQSVLTSWVCLGNFVFGKLRELYGISLSQMTTDMFHLSLAFPCPFLVHDLSPGLQHCGCH